MRILHTSDLHIGKYLDTYDLTSDTEYVLNQVIKIAEEEKIETVLLSGDIFDRSNPSEEAVKLYSQFLTRLLDNGKRKVIAIAGNHDSGIRLAAYKNLFDKNSGYYVEGQVTSPFKKITLTDEYGPINFYLVPFFYPFEIKNLLNLNLQGTELTDDAVFKELMKRENIDTSQRNIILAHQFVAGYSLSGSEQTSLVYNEAGGLSNIGLENFKDFDYVALGHIHKPQKLTKDTIRYSGALLKYKSSEVNGPDKSVVIIDIKEKGNIKIDLKPITPLHPMVKVEGMFNDLLKTNQHKDDYAIINVLDERIPVGAGRLLGQYYHNFIEINFPNVKDENVLKKNIAFTKDDPISFLKSYYKERTGKDIDEDELKIVEEIFQESAKEN